MVLADKSAPTTNRGPALQRALDLMPLLSKELGRDWLHRNFQKSPGEGMAILATIGGVVAQGYAAERDAEKRRKNLDLQRRTVEELLAMVGPETKPWRPALNIVAYGWLQEAEQSSAINHAGRSSISRSSITIPWQSDLQRLLQRAEHLPESNEPAPILIETCRRRRVRRGCRADKSLLLKTRSLIAELFLATSKESAAVHRTPRARSSRPPPESRQRIAPKLGANQRMPINRRRHGAVYYKRYGGSADGGVLPDAPRARCALAQLTDVLARLRKLPIGALTRRPWSAPSPPLTARPRSSRRMSSKSSASRMT
jgi:hypothetical protein